jgi:hypothetical protein
LIEYLALSRKDYDAAAAAAEEATHWIGANADDLRVMVEIERGDKEKAAKLLATPPNIANWGHLNKAAYFAKRGRRCLELGMIDEAREFAAETLELDAYHGDVMGFQAQLALETGDHGACLQWLEAKGQRYGVSWPDIILRARAVWESGDKQGAVLYLEKELVRFPSWINLAPVLMEYYAELGEAERAEHLMQYILNAPARSRTAAEAALPHYARLFPEKAEEIRQGLPGLVLGPDSLEAIADLKLMSDPVLPRAGGGGS